MIIGSTYVIVQLISITTPAITTCLMSILGKRLLILALLNYFARALMDLEESNIFYIFITTLHRNELYELFLKDFVNLYLIYGLK